MANISKKLTSLAVNALKPKAQKYICWDTGNPSFGVRVNKSGKKSYIYDAGNFGYMTFGSYPAMSLKEARVLYDIAYEKAKSGEDPKQTEDEVITVAQFLPVVEKHLRRRKGKHGLHLSTKHIQETLNKYKNYMIPEIGDLALKKVTVKHIAGIMNKLDDREVYVQKNRVQTAMKQFFEIAGAHGEIEYDPTSFSHKLKSPETPRERVLEDYEIKYFWEWLELRSRTESQPVNIALRLLLLTGQRVSEVTNATLDEFVDNIWHRPSTRNKNKRDWKAEIPDGIFNIFKMGMGLEPSTNIDREKYLLPTYRRVSGSINSDSISQAIYKGFKQQQLKINKFTPHDLRRTFNTRILEKFKDQYMAKSMLNHVVIDNSLKTSDINEQVYNQSQFLEEKFKAMEWWHEEVRRIVNSEYPEYKSFQVELEYSAHQASQILGVSRIKINSLLDNNKIQFRKSGRRRLIKKSDLDSYVSLNNLKN